MYTQNSIPLYTAKGEDSRSPSNFFYGGTGSLDEPEFSIKSYFNIVYYEGDFLKAIYSVLVEKDGFCEEGADCYYPDMNSPFPEDHFEGVRFEIGGLCDPRYQVHVSEEICFMYFKKACERFLELHPEKEYAEFIYDILNNWEPLKMK